MPLVREIKIGTSPIVSNATKSGIKVKIRS